MRDAVPGMCHSERLRGGALCGCDRGSMFGKLANSRRQSMPMPGTRSPLSPSFHHQTGPQERTYVVWSPFPRENARVAALRRHGHARRCNPNPSHTHIHTLTHTRVPAWPTGLLTLTLMRRAYAGFGSSSRETEAKVFATAEHAAKSVGVHSPGPVYAAMSTVCKPTTLRGRACLTSSIHSAAAHVHTRSLTRGGCGCVWWHPGEREHSQGRHTQHPVPQILQERALPVARQGTHTHTLSRIRPSRLD